MTDTEKLAICEAVLASEIRAHAVTRECSAQLLEALRALMGDPSIEKCTMTNLEFCRTAIKAAEEKP